ncbi:MAG TPA: hypothetical protein DDY91_00415 [Planctomycetaceae bacterium]|nr:hypothetical protein [Planctomycetaceae bacterium]
MTLLPVPAGHGVVAGVCDPESRIAMAIPIEPRQKTDPVRSEPFAPAHSNRIANPEIIREELRSIAPPSLCCLDAVIADKAGTEATTVSPSAGLPKSRFKT